MRLCYIDESGCTGMLPHPTSEITPVLALAGLVVEQVELRPLTFEFLELKRRFYPGLFSGPRRRLLSDSIRHEIKGADVRRDARDKSRNVRRHAFGFLDKILDLLELHRAQLMSRIWVKAIGAPIDGRAIYAYSAQCFCDHFQHLLAVTNDDGFVIADSRDPLLNASVSHSIFTQKFKALGDQYDRILEMPTFGHSENHVGLQLADLLASALLFPMAAITYCSGVVKSKHVQPKHRALRDRYGVRLRALEYRYQDGAARWHDGIVVSDPLGHKSAHAMLTAPAVLKDEATGT